MRTKGRTICLDFDGVLHSYTSGFGANKLDPPVPGARAFVQALLGAGWNVVVCTSRLNSQWPDAAECETAIYRWLREYGFPDVKVVSEKPAALVYIDDRGYRFDGSFDRALEFVSSNRKLDPWNKREQRRRRKPPKPTAETILLGGAGDPVSAVEYEQLRRPSKGPIW